MIGRRENSLQNLNTPDSCENRHIDYKVLPALMDTVTKGTMGDILTVKYGSGVVSLDTSACFRCPAKVQMSDPKPKIPPISVRQKLFARVLTAYREPGRNV